MVMAGEVSEDPQWIHDNWKMWNIRVLREMSNTEPSNSVEVA